MARRAGLAVKTAPAGRLQADPKAACAGWDGARMQASGSQGAIGFHGGTILLRGIIVLWVGAYAAARGVSGYDEMGLWEVSSWWHGKMHVAARGASDQ